MDSRLEKARQELTDEVMGRPGVTGTAIGERGGKICLVVYLRDKAAGKGIPDSVRGVRVVQEVTGEIRPL